ncbi:Flp family type IVb pilin [Paremcibacter congregatus]|uniref:Flp family type IVb pilin n=1 Tax=Paremcibacter congregatus TaxID=2043170 RepID=UPI0030EBBB61|tara:strand:+ start:4741 stop:4923 length:183 start_codon:yes stop_codon:yes gene_type:complete
MKHFIKTLYSQEKGATAIEYGLITALIVVASIGALTAMSSTVVTNFNTTSSKVNRAMNGQ